MAQGKRSSRVRYRKAADLYVTGREVVLRDGSVLWLQPMNPFELEDARRDAQVARARMVMALQEHGSDEQARVRVDFRQLSREVAVNIIAAPQVQEAMIKFGQELTDDPEWAEKLSIMNRSDEIIARPITDPERELLTKINEEWLVEWGTRSKQVQEQAAEDLKELTTEQLEDKFIEAAIETQGMDRMMAEYRLSELWHAARVCEAAVPAKVGEDEHEPWDHGECRSHQFKAFETREDLRAMPSDFLEFLAAEMEELNITVMEAKGLASHRSSSEPLMWPNEVEALEPSGPTETSDDAHGG